MLLLSMISFSLFFSHFAISIDYTYSLLRMNYIQEELRKLKMVLLKFSFLQSMAAEVACLPLLLMQI